MSAVAGRLVAVEVTAALAAQASVFKWEADRLVKVSDEVHSKLVAVRAILRRPVTAELLATSSARTVTDPLEAFDVCSRTLIGCLDALLAIDAAVS